MGRQHRNRHWTILLPLLLFASTVHAQEVVLIRATPLYERPSLEATTTATLPAGIRLTLNSRRGEWLVVTTSEGLIGWIPRLVAHVEGEAPPTDVVPAPLPPPREPAGDESDARAESSQADPPGQPLGFYNRRKRSALSFSSGTLDSQSQVGDAGTTRRVGLSWGSMKGGRFEWGGSVSGGKYDVSALEPWYDLQIGAKLNFFLLQPRGATPIGVYVGGLLAWTQYYLGSNTSSNVSTLHYGGDAGVYFHFGTRPLIVPRAAWRFEKVSYTGSDRPPGGVVSEGVARAGTFSSFLLGLDLSFGGFVPGLWVTSRDGSTLLMLRATLAY